MRGGIIDLARERQDGYDLTEWLDDNQTLTIEQLHHALRWAENPITLTVGTSRSARADGR